MPSTYTQNLGLEKIATGEQAGVWGNTVDNTWDYLDTGIDGGLAITLAAPAYSLITNQGTLSEGRNKVVNFSGSLAQNAVISILPNTAQKIYFVLNSTSGGHDLIFQQGTGAQFTLKPGRSAIIYANGLGAGAGVTGLLANLQTDNLLVTTALVIAGSATFQQPVTFSQPATYSTLATFNAGIATTAPVTLNLGGDAPGDLYYRSAAGTLARVPIGSPGQAMTVSGGSTPQWATVSLAIGNVVAGSTAWDALFVNASGQMTQDNNFRFVPGVGLGVGLNPGHPLHVGGAFHADLWLDGPVTSLHRTIYAVSGAARANMRLDGVGESGGNTGSNWIISSYNDPANAETVHLVGFRNNGRTTIGGYGDLGGKVNIWSQNADPALVVRGGAGGWLQIWQDPNGNTLAYIDAAGRPTFPGGGAQYISLTNNRLDLWGAAAGHPLGTIHIGNDPSGTGYSKSSLVMETTQGIALEPLPPNCFRLFLSRGSNLTIQFYYNGTQYYLQCPLVGQQGQATWTIGPSFNG